MKTSRAQAGSKGMTLIEVVIGLMLVVAMVIVFGTSLTAAVFAETANQRHMAETLANQELATLQAVGASRIPVQTNGPLLGLIFSQGQWATVADATAPSASNVYAGVSIASATTITAVYPLPQNAYADGLYSLKVKVPSPAPADWRVGLVFRATDLQNGYQLYLTSTNLKLDRVVDGVATNLYSDARSISVDTWQTLAVTATASNLAISLNGTTAGTVVDTAFSVGQAALAVWGGGAGHFDDIMAGSTTWNFDTATTETVPDDWLRFGLANLPSGTAKLTTSILYGDSAFKKTDVTISWRDRQGAKELAESTFIRN